MLFLLVVVVAFSRESATKLRFACGSAIQITYMYDVYQSTDFYDN